MKKAFRMWIVFLLAVICALSMFACGNEDTSGGGNTPPVVPSEPENPEKPTRPEEPKDPEKPKDPETPTVPDTPADATKGLTYALRTDGESYAVTGIEYAARGEVVVIAKTHLSKPVTEIADRAFAGCDEMQSVAIPEGITRIGKEAFLNCGLTSLTLPAGVKRIELSAFSACGELSALVIPSSVEYVGRSAFYMCEKLADLAISEGVTEIDDTAFSLCASLTEVTVPDSVQRIGAGAFGGCDSVQSITVPFVGECNYASDPNKEAQHIFRYIFGDQLPAALKSVVITSETYLDTGAFDGFREVERDKIQSITLPATLTGIGINAFAGCGGLTGITIPGSVKTIGWGAFQSCAALKTVTLENGIETIEENAFLNCVGIESIVLPDSIQKIEGGAFSHCENLTEITMPYAVDGRKTQSDCKQYPLGYIFDSFAYDGGRQTTQTYYDGDHTNDLQTIYFLPKKLKKVTVTSGHILRGAFSGCAQLTDIVIGDGVKSVAESAFANCDSLTYNEYENGLYLGNTANPYAVLVKAKDATATDFTLHADTKFVCGDAWKNCANLSYTVSDNGRYIGSASNPHAVLAGVVDTTASSFAVNENTKHILGGAFESCANVTELAIPDGVVSIGTGAFANCNKLQSVSLPRSVVSLGFHAFTGCAALSRITVAADNAEFAVQDDCLLNVSRKLLVVCFGDEIPDDGGIEHIGAYAFGSVGGFTEIRLPQGIKEVPSYAFRDLTSLQSVTLPAGIAKIDYGAFFGCTGLTEIVVPDSVSEIRYRAFEDCSNLRRVEIGSGLRTIEGDVFRNCDSLAEIVVSPDNETFSVAGNCLINKVFESVVFGWGEVTVPDDGSVTKIGDSAFDGCTNLTGITLPHAIKEIGYHAFNGCAGLTEIVIPSSVVTVRRSAFEGCTGLTIYCEAESAPSGWEEGWNPSNCTVVWGYKAA